MLKCLGRFIPKEVFSGERQGQWRDLQDRIAKEDEGVALIFSQCGWPSASSMRCRELCACLCKAQWMGMFQQNNRKSPPKKWKCFAVTHFKHFKPPGACIGLCSYFCTSWSLLQPVLCKKISKSTLLHPPLVTWSWGLHHSPCPFLSTLKGLGDLYRNWWVVIPPVWEPLPCLGLPCFWEAPPFFKRVK